jgi:hypothetical protein
MNRDDNVPQRPHPVPPAPRATPPNRHARRAIISRGKVERGERVTAKCNACGQVIFQARRTWRTAEDVAMAFRRHCRRTGCVAVEAIEPIDLPPPRTLLERIRETEQGREGIADVRAPQPVPTTAQTSESGPVEVGRVGDPETAQGE